MKHSKELTKWLRKRSWAVFMGMTPKMRKFVYNNSFESYCKTLKSASGINKELNKISEDESKTN